MANQQPAGGDPFRRLISTLESSDTRFDSGALSVQQPIGTRLNCPTCGELIQLCETAGQYRGRGIRFWSPCTCSEAARAASERAVSVSDAYQAAQRSETGPARSEIGSVRHMTLETLDPSRYPPNSNPLAEGRAWLAGIRDLVQADFHRGPLCCLYLYSAGKGRGKTHMAAGLAAVAVRDGRQTFFADEISYIERYWALPLDRKAELSAQAGERAWLTVIDDLGQRESTPPSLRDAWYAVLNPRWLKRGWTIVTSNYTPDELLLRGTINEATHSRLMQMCGGVLINFDSGDYRVEAEARHA